MVERSSSKIHILRLKQLIERTGLSRSSIYDRMNPGSPRYDPSFPKQISLGLKSVGWEEEKYKLGLQIVQIQNAQRMDSLVISHKVQR